MISNSDIKINMKLHWIALAWTLACSANAFGQSRYAASDNHSGYVHWIDLYDENNTRIDPSVDNPKPYSPEKTCGRCHDQETISHGWHFDAVVDDSLHGRPGQPWIWNDPRTGTHLPLSYRDWQGTHNPDDLGLTRWEVAAKFGGYLPGGGPGSQDSLGSKSEAGSGNDVPADDASKEDENIDDDPPVAEHVDRTNVTGPLPVDCMICHFQPGSGYSPFVWTEQIEDENFAYAPTAALGIGTISGSMRRLKDDFDSTAEGAEDKLPKVTYDAGKFREDGKVFIDLLRKPDNNACYYCHTNTPSNAVTGDRWLHDEDIHLRAGFQCADCHRNGIAHETVRGYLGEKHPAGTKIASLSCQGCHLGPIDGSHGLEEKLPDELEFASAGRLGAPRPAHKGLPPIHFEKMTCTACHSGAPLKEQVGRELNSIVHRLGEHEKRTGDEYPGIVAPIHLRVNDAGYWNESPESSLVDADAGENSSKKSDADPSIRYAPHRMMWPSFWGTIQDGEITVLNPELAYELTRKALRVRKNFTEELAEVKLSLSTRKELIGEDRARLREDDWTEEEKAKLEAAEAVEREKQVTEAITKALAAIEEAFPELQAVYVSGGNGFIRDGEDALKTLGPEELGPAAEPYAWPLAHNVRGAQQALGSNGCVECHSDGALFFNAEVRPVGLIPGQEIQAIAAHVLQKADMQRLTTWNQLFLGRSIFKILGIIALGLAGVVTISAVAWNLGNWVRR